MQAELKRLYTQLQVYKTKTMRSMRVCLSVCLSVTTVSPTQDQDDMAHVFVCLSVCLLVTRIMIIHIQDQDDAACLSVSLSRP